MPVVHMNEAELAALGGRLSEDPAVDKLYRLIKERAEREGGTTLAVWRLHMARLWGEPLMMTSDEVASRLKLPVSVVEGAITSVRKAAREQWLATEEYRNSQFAAEE